MSDSEADELGVLLAKQSRDIEAQQTPNSNGSSPEPNVGSRLRQARAKSWNQAKVDACIGPKTGNLLRNQEPTSAEAVILNEWQICFHEAMAALLRTTTAVKYRPFGIARIVGPLSRTIKDMTPLARLVKQLAEDTRGAVAPESLRLIVPQLSKVIVSIEDLLDAGECNGLLNRSFTARAFKAMRLRGEEFAEALDTIEMSLDPEIAGTIAEGREQSVCAGENRLSV